MEFSAVKQLPRKVSESINFGFRAILIIKLRLRFLNLLFLWQRCSSDGSSAPFLKMLKKMSTGSHNTLDKEVEVDDECHGAKEEDEVIPDNKTPTMLVVESVHTFKYEPKTKELQFLVKWRNITGLNRKNSEFPETAMFFEPINKIKDSRAYKEFIIRFAEQFEPDIELNSCRLQKKLTSKIESFKRNPETAILKEIETFDYIEFRAFQALSQIATPYKSFYEKYEHLFFIDCLAKLPKP